MKYRVLYVDDSIDDAHRIMNIIKDKLNCIDFDYCTDKNQALKKIKFNHYHMALIDVQLRKQNDATQSGDFGGLDIMRELKKKKPSCYRMLISEYFREYRDEVFLALTPDDRLTLDIVTKKGTGSSIVQQLDAIINERLYINLQLQYKIPKNVIKRFRKKFKGNEVTEKILTQEIGFLLQSGFSDYYLSNSNKEFIISNIVCEELTEGRSTSIVFKISPSKNGHEYNKVVVKIGPNHITESEYNNYLRWVKWFKEYHNRTELLGYYEADNIAAIFYSFAGGSKAEYHSLSQIIFSNEYNWSNNEYIKLIHDIFDPEKKEFYSDAWITQSDSLKDYYLENFFKNKVHNYQNAFEKWASNQHFISVKSAGSSLKIEGNENFKNPFNYILSTKSLVKYYECVCHGDMIAANIMANQTGKYIIIDFANTGIAPIELDFVTMEASIRLSSFKEEKFEKLLKFEKILTYKGCEKHIHKGENYLNVAEKDCINIIAHIRFLYKENFPDHYNLQRYYLNCLFVALKLICISTLSETQKYSLLAWSLATQEQLLERR